MVLFGTRRSPSLVAANSDNLDTPLFSTGSGELVSDHRQSKANSDDERSAAVYALLLDSRAASVSASDLAATVASAA